VLEEIMKDILRGGPRDEAIKERSIEGYDDVGKRRPKLQDGLPKGSNVDQEDEFWEAAMEARRKERIERSRGVELRRKESEGRSEIDSEDQVHSSPSSGPGLASTKRADIPYWRTQGNPQRRTFIPRVEEDDNEEDWAQ
jgi:hypothetical protein